LHTIGVIYLRENKSREFLTFVDEDIIASGIRVISVAPDNFSKITGSADRFHLDFDDAYQYAVAEQNRLSIVSFDKDFDRTKKRKSGTKRSLLLIPVVSSPRHPAQKPHHIPTTHPPKAPVSHYPPHHLS